MNTVLLLVPVKMLACQKSRKKVKIFKLLEYYAFYLTLHLIYVRAEQANIQSSKGRATPEILSASG